MKTVVLGITTLVVALVLAVVLYDQLKSPSERGDEGVHTATPQEIRSESEAEPRYPVPPPPVQPPAKTPPTVEPPITVESAKPAPQPEPPPSFTEQLSRIFSGSRFIALLRQDDFIQRFVATVDSIPEQQPPSRYLPVTPPAGTFLVSRDRINPENARRYLPYLDLLEFIGRDRAIDLYLTHYPQFQSAYRQLGYPRGHFNDRLVAVIDHLLLTPRSNEPIAVHQTVITYRYQDPNLEALSPGQKLLIRIGADNRQGIEVFLRQIRARLVAL